MQNLPQKRSSTEKIIRATGIVTVITISVKLLGFVEKMVLAYYFGTSMEVDAYLIAFSIPFMIFILSREMIEPAFLPTFMGSIKDGDEKAGWKLFSAVFNILLVLLAIVTVLGVIGAPSLVKIFAPGFEGMKKVLTIKLTRIAMPASVFLGLSALTYITLNSYKRFTVPALGDLFFKGLIIGVMVISYSILGIVGLAIGVILGAMARLVVHIMGLWEKRKLYVCTFDVRNPLARRMGKLMLPLVIGIAFSQLSTIVDNMFASTLETGSVSALAYSKKLVEMPVVVLPYALGVVIFPFFSELAISHEKEKLVEMLMHAIKLLAFIFIPAAVGLLLLRDPVVKLIFQRGAFDVHSAQLTSSALFYYTLGLFTFAVEVILVQFYFSMSDTKTPIVVGIACVLLNIVITVILIRSLAHCGIALALTISKTVKICILYGLLKRKIEGIRLREPVPFFVKMGAACAMMGLAVFFVSVRLPLLNSPAVTTQAVGLIAMTLVGIVVFITAVIIMRLEEIGLYWGYLKSKVMKVGK